MAAEDENGSRPAGPVDNAWSLKVPEFAPGDMKYNLQEESSFSVLFPKYRERYIRESWTVLEAAFNEHKIMAELDLIEGRMTVRTTKKTWDPYIILKARDVIVLLGRSVPIEQAVKVLKDDVTMEIIKIRSLVHNKERFVKRRQRLVGSNGTTLKALELLTDCYVLIQGGTVAAIGPYRGVQQVRKVVIDTMKNIHPIYLLKALMIKRQLAKDERLKNEDWSRFIPSFASKNVPRKKPKVKKKKKEYTPFPPSMPERKIDHQLGEGKFFIDQEEEKKQKRRLVEDKKKEKAMIRKEERAKPYIPPEESAHKLESPKVNEDVDIEAMKRKMKKRKLS